MNKKLPFVLSLIILFAISVFANTNATTLARQAISVDKNESQTAIRSLRGMNQTGLDTLFEVYKNEIENYKKTGNKTDSWNKISNAIDNVAMQKDAFAAKLFWHTDFEKAKAAAQKSNKPILTLRLLGNLNEEYSCANSRFFRSILYSNERISNELRENYILHWKSVRPAPKVTIDFGDGRKLVRTITGNSIHYILDKDGKILDAIPGLYSPKVFHEYIKRVNASYQENSSDDFFWRNYHTFYRDQLYKKWETELKKSGVRISREIKNILKPKDEEKPTALEATRVTATKMATEVSLVRTISSDVNSLKENTSAKDWEKLSKTFGKAKIDGNSRNFIRIKTNNELKANEKEFIELIKNLEKYVSLDTAMNEFLIHGKLYEWLATGQIKDVDTFNEKVYSELFLTPRSDKWLGLYSPDIYSAIENNGIIN